MKKAVIGILSMCIIMFAVIQVPKFVSGAQDAVSILEQVDAILESAKFDNQVYTSKIQKKALQASMILSEGSTEQLVMMYISEKLKTKIAHLQREELALAQIKAKEEAQKQIALAQGGSEKVTQLGYSSTNSHITQAQQLNKGNEEHQAAESGSVGIFNMGKKEAPKVVQKERVSYATPDFQYKLGNFVYDKSCVQLACLNVCMNKYDKELADCKSSCTSSECLETVRRSRGIEKYKVDFDQ